MRELNRWFRDHYGVPVRVIRWEPQTQRVIYLREGYEHAFAEPLVGLVQYVPIRRCLDEDMVAQSLWRSEWATPDVFRIYQD